MKPRRETAISGLFRPATCLAAAALLLGLFNAAPPAIAGRAPSSTTSSGAVTLLLPDRTDPRWQQVASAFVQRMDSRLTNPKWLVLNAHDSEATQVQQAQTAVASGTKVLIVAPVNSASSGQIVPMAHRKGVKVIAYDWPIEAKNLDLYVGFDPVDVGKLQGDFIASHVPQGGKLVFINGPSHDDIAKSQRQGYYDDVLRPEVLRHRFYIVGRYWPPSWSSNGSARLDMQDALFRNNNKVQGVVAADDTLASGVMDELSQDHLSGSITLTGSDATVTALRAILQGTQGMTVYKPVYREADAAADAAIALLEHKAPPAEFDTHYQMRAGLVKAALFQPTAITRANIASTVIKDHFVTTKELCTGIESLCRKYHA